jgi:hypothetical protein
MENSQASLEQLTTRGDLAAPVSTNAWQRRLSADKGQPRNRRASGDQSAGIGVFLQRRRSIDEHGRRLSTGLFDSPEKMRAGAAAYAAAQAQAQGGAEQQSQRGVNLNSLAEVDHALKQMNEQLQNGQMGPCTVRLPHAAHDTLPSVAAHRRVRPIAVRGAVRQAVARQAGALQRVRRHSRGRHAGQPAARRLVIAPRLARALSERPRRVASVQSAPWPWPVPCSSASRAVWRIRRAVGRAAFSVTEGRVHSKYRCRTDHAHIAWWRGEFI